MPTTDDRQSTRRAEQTYTFLRTAMVLLLVGLAVAVVWQTGRQGWQLLGSVSAYYHTSAQAVFVGALVGLGACMIVLKGTPPVEDVLLNLGGAFAVVVAIVPTSRGGDYKRAEYVCKHAADPVVAQTVLPDGMKCPDVAALKSATIANVQNNMVALLVVGILALLATLLFTVGEERSDRVTGSRFGTAGTPVREIVHALRNAGKGFWWGFCIAAGLWLVGLVALVASTESVVSFAHYVAAAGLFLCIVGVAFVNARRRGEMRRGTATGRNANDHAGRGESGVREAVARYRYTTIAVTMLVVTVFLAGLWATGRIPLFWLEIVVAGLFAVFWMVQTVEQRSPEPPDEPRTEEREPEMARS
jgi:hypothetical protein